MVTKGRTSVIIPVYNGHKYIEEAVATVVQQTRPVKEVIIIDDGSDPPIRMPRAWSPVPLILIRTENRGLGAARNLAVRYCSGEYLALLDCDDCWHPEKIALQEDMLDAHRRAVLCYTRVGYFPDPAAKPPPRYPSNTRKEQLDELWRRNYILPSSVMVRRTAWHRVGGTEPSLSGVADWELWWRLAYLGPFVFLPQTLTYYRLHEEQMTKNLYNMLREEVLARSLMTRKVYQLLKRLGLRSGEISQALDSTRRFFYDYIIYYQRRPNNIKDVVLAIWKHINDPKSVTLFVRSLVPRALITTLKNTWRCWHKA